MPDHHLTYVCHLPADEPLARRLYWALRTWRFRPWMESVDAMPGEAWDEQIPNMIRSVDLVLVLVTPSWPARGTKHPDHYMLERIHEAIKSVEGSDTRVVPVLVDGVSNDQVPFGLGRVNPIRVEAEKIGTVPKKLPRNMFPLRHEPSSRAIPPMLAGACQESMSASVPSSSPATPDCWTPISVADETPELDRSVTSAWLTFVHLGDIHFGCDGADGWEPDEGLRDALDSELTRLSTTRGGVDGILVAGNSAYAGRSVEFQAALEWLYTLVESTGCPEDHVWVVPGWRDLHPATPVLAGDDVGMSPAVGSGGYGRLQDFDGFAAHFDCHLGPERRPWRSLLRFSDGCGLLLVGRPSLGTSLGEAPRDHVGSASPVRGPCLNTGHVVLELTHQPPSETTIELHGAPKDQEVPHIRLVGGVADEPTGPTLGLAASLLIPSSPEAERSPNYNLLRLRTTRSAHELHIEASVDRWIWSAVDQCFVSACGVDAPSTSHLRRRIVEPVPAQPATAGHSMPIPLGAPVEPKPVEVAMPALDPASFRAVVRRFMRLPLYVRFRLLVEEGVLAPDTHVPEIFDPVWVDALRRIGSDALIIERIRSGIDTAQSFE